MADGELLGKKAGRGFYVYDNGHKRLNPDVSPLIEDARAADDVDAHDLTDVGKPVDDRTGDRRSDRQILQHGQRLAETGLGFNGGRFERRHLRFFRFDTFRPEFRVVVYLPRFRDHAL